MEKLFSQIVGTHVTPESEPIPIAKIYNVILDPDTGKVVALSVHPFLKYVITPMDIHAWYKYIVIEDEESIAEANDIMRVKEVLKKDIPIYKNRVETKNGEYLGKVVDFMIDTKFMQLTKIYVAKTFLGLVQMDQRIISADNILRVEKDKIVVKNATVKEPATVKDAVLAPNLP